MRNIKYIVLHCTATPQTATPASIKQYWKDVLGWKNPGYHFLITPDGEIHHLLPIERVANGVRGYNQGSIHISYIGGVNGQGQPMDNRTAAQKSAQETLVRKYRDMFPDAIVQGHRDFPNVAKACPSFDVAAWLKQIGLILCVLFMFSCGSKKKTVKASYAHSQVQAAKVTRVSTLKKKTITYGDTLTGSFPLPSLSDLPITIPVRSNGLELEISLTNDKITYQAIATPVTVENTEETTDSITTQSNSETTTREVITKERRTRLPWCFYMAVIAGLAALVYFKLPTIKNTFKILLKYF